MAKPFYAYMLLCADDSYYVGQTDDLDDRVAEHQAGIGCAYTSVRRPVQLVWSETFSTRDDAKRAEAQIKGWSRAKKAALVRGDFGAISVLARNHQSREH